VAGEPVPSGQRRQRLADLGKPCFDLADRIRVGRRFRVRSAQLAEAMTNGNSAT
jgi:hypothetical protein